MLRNALRCIRRHVKPTYPLATPNFKGGRFTRIVHPSLHPLYFPLQYFSPLDAELLQPTGHHLHLQ